jgi:cytochrome c-type biogenesis protein CcmH/NrfG
MALAVWARFTTGYRYKMSHHVWAGVVLVVFSLLAYFAVGAYLQMHHRQQVQAAWVQGPKVAHEPGESLS